MGVNKSTKKKKHVISLILLFIILLEFNFIFYYAVARDEDIPDFWTEDTVNPGEHVSYYFPNNIIFEISTNSLIDLYIEYDNNIRNRQSFFIFSNNESIFLNITSKINMKSYGISNPPSNPKKGTFQLRYKYNCIFKIRSNTSIQNLTILYRKNSLYGLKPSINYSLAIYESSQESWELIDTEEKVNESTSEPYLESSLLGLGGGIDYFVTLFEFTVEPYDWTWLITTILISAVSILSIAYLISKKDYFQYLRTRTISIEKGAHRLSLDDVLENENRSKIIELILNEPGIHFNELLRKTGLAAGNLVWHLDILQTYKIIGKKRVGNFIAYFPYYQRNPISNVDLKLQKSKLTLEILEMIEQDPGIWNNLITKKLKVDHKTIQYHIMKLEELGLVNFKKEGRKKKIFPNLDSEYFNRKNEQ
ncbi:MAG: winged helix-turn-helix transcriptional regulator [Candidatus Hodarchaeota archaeon]